MLPARTWQVLLIASTVGLCWLAMMSVHESGHVLGAWLSGGRVQHVVLHPLTISRTDVSPNPHPLFVAWGGAIWGAGIPLGLWLVSFVILKQYRYLLAFFAGFCCLANGLYLAAGSLTGAGDAGDLLKHGATQWQLILFGLPLAACGLWMWNGLGEARGKVDRRTAITMAGLFLVWACFSAVFSAS